MADFVGETNFLTGTITTEDGRRVVVIPGRGRVAAPRGSTDGPATIMVRPEYVRMRAVGEAATDPGFPGRIINVAFLGDHTRITLTTAAGEIFAVRPHGTGGRSTRWRRTWGRRCAYGGPRTTRHSSATDAVEA